MQPLRYQTSDINLYSNDLTFEESDLTPEQILSRAKFNQLTLLEALDQVIISRDVNEFQWILDSCTSTELQAIYFLSQNYLKRLLITEGIPAEFIRIFLSKCPDEQSRAKVYEPDKLGRPLFCYSRDSDSMLYLLQYTPSENLKDLIGYTGNHEVLQEFFFQRNESVLREVLNISSLNKIKEFVSQPIIYHYMLRNGDEDLLTLINCFPLEVRNTLLSQVDEINKHISQIQMTLTNKSKDFSVVEIRKIVIRALIAIDEKQYFFDYQDNSFRASLREGRLKISKYFRLLYRGSRNGVELFEKIHSVGYTCLKFAIHPDYNRYILAETNHLSYLHSGKQAHPSIQKPVKGLFEGPYGKLMFEMHYYSEGTLDQKLMNIAAPFKNAGKLLKADIKELFSPIKYLHDNNLVHGDIKPSNFFLNKNRSYVISDFEGLGCADEPLNQNSMRSPLYSLYNDLKLVTKADPTAI